MKEAQLRKDVAGQYGYSQAHPYPEPHDNAEEQQQQLEGIEYVAGIIICNCVGTN